MGIIFGTEEKPLDFIKLEDLYSDELFKESLTKFHDRFFTEGWIKDETKLKAVLFYIFKSNSLIKDFEKLFSSLKSTVDSPKTKISDLTPNDLLPLIFSTDKYDPIKLNDTFSLLCLLYKFCYIFSIRKQTKLVLGINYKERSNFYDLLFDFQPNNKPLGYIAGVILDDGIVKFNSEFEKNNR